MEGKKAGQRHPGAAVLMEGAGRSWKGLEDRCLCVGSHIVGLLCTLSLGTQPRGSRGFRTMQTFAAGRAPRGLFQRLRRFMLKLALKQP